MLVYQRVFDEMCLSFFFPKCCCVRKCVDNFVLELLAQRNGRSKRSDF